MALKPSPRFAMLLLLSHAITALAVYAAAMPPAARLAIILLILLSLLYHLARDALLLSPDSWCDITLDRGRVSVVSRNGSVLAGLVANQTLVSRHCVVLRVRPDSQRLTVSRVIFPDALGAGEFRDFCVRLKFA